MRARPDLFREGHILDVGANIGYTATLFAEALSPGFRVYAFEPEERNFTWLEEAIAERSLQSSVIPMRVAVGDRQGQLELWVNPHHHADHRMVTELFKGEAGSARKTESVPVVRLDDFWSSKLKQAAVRFIKIDVQGYEEKVCLGMSGMLEKNPQAVISLEYAPESIHALGYKPTDALQFFKTRAYDVYALSRSGPLRKITYDEVSSLVLRKGYIDLLFSKSDKISDGKFS